MERRERLILIVDDSPEDREVVRRYLNHDPLESYRFLEETTGAEALVLCRSAALDCMLIDYSLPDMDGLELLKRLIDEDGPPPFPILMLTGRGSEKIAVQALKHGAQDYLVKGHFTSELLCATITEAVESFARRPRRDRQRATTERDEFEARETLRQNERLVLVVDDSPEDRTMVVRYLAGDPRTTYRFVEESTGANGLALCRTAGVDCLVLDYSLPDMNGLEFLDELTAGTAITPFPVVMLTGRGDELVAVQALKHGAQDYLIKGRFSDETLRRTVDNAIASVIDRRLIERQRMRMLERLEREARKRADELAEMDRRKNEFLAMLAHELRNPLAPIRSALHVMSLPGVDEKTSARVREMAKRQVGQLARLVDDLLEVSRITRGKIQLCKSAIEAGAVANRAAEAVRPIMDQGGHNLTVTLPTSPIHLEADPTRLEQILVNLLNNAAKYTESGGHVHLSVDRDGDVAVFRVTDDGIGLAPEALATVFDMFAQVDRSIDRSRGGLGIGLTLVKTLAQLHGGGVTASSAGLGRGSEFVVRLPALPGHVERPPSSEAADDDKAGPEDLPVNILVVEDNLEGAEILSTMLRLWGHKVHIAHDGPGALNAVETEAPEMILLDLGLPQMNGYEVAERLRERTIEPRPFLVALTGYGQAEARLRSADAGFDVHLVKPVDPDDLERLINDFRRSRPSYRL